MCSEIHIYTRCNELRCEQRTRRTQFDRRISWLVNISHSIYLSAFRLVIFTAGKALWSRMLLTERRVIRCGCSTNSYVISHRILEHFIHSSINWSHLWERLFLDKKNCNSQQEFENTRCRQRSMSNWQCVYGCKQTKNAANWNSNRQNATIITRHRIEWMNKWSGYQWSRFRKPKRCHQTHMRIVRIEWVILCWSWTRDTLKTCNRSSCDVTISFVVRFALETDAVNHSFGETLHRMWDTYGISFQRNDVNCVFSDEAYRRWVFALDALVSIDRFPMTLRHA